MIRYMYENQICVESIVSSRKDNLIRNSESSTELHKNVILYLKLWKWNCPDQPHHKKTTTAITLQKLSMDKDLMEILSRIFVAWG